MTRTRCTCACRQRRPLRQPPRSPAPTRGHWGSSAGPVPTAHQSDASRPRGPCDLPPGPDAASQFRPYGGWARTAPWSQQPRPAPGRRAQAARSTASGSTMTPHNSTAARTTCCTDQECTCSLRTTRTQIDDRSVMATNRASRPQMTIASASRQRSDARPFLEWCCARWAPRVTGVQPTRRNQP